MLQLVWWITRQCTEFDHLWCGHQVFNVLSKHLVFTPQSQVFLFHPIHSTAQLFQGALKFQHLDSKKKLTCNYEKLNLTKRNCKNRVYEVALWTSQTATDCLEDTIGNFNGFKETIVEFYGFEETMDIFWIVFEETITIEYFIALCPSKSMVFGSFYHWFQWLSMVSDHRSNDGMVSMDRYPLGYGAVTKWSSSATDFHWLALPL